MCVSSGAAKPALAVTIGLPLLLSEWCLPTGRASCPQKTPSRHTHTQKYPVCRWVCLNNSQTHTQTHHDVTPSDKPLFIWQTAPFSLFVCVYPSWSQFKWRIKEESHQAVGEARSVFFYFRLTPQLIVFSFRLVRLICSKWIFHCISKKLLFFLLFSLKSSADWCRAVLCSR